MEKKEKGQEKRICYFLRENGYCKKGSACMFLHPKELKKICPVYQSGQICKFGKKCYFLHPFLEREYVEKKSVVEENANIINSSQGENKQAKNENSQQPVESLKANIQNDDEKKSEKEKQNPNQGDQGEELKKSEAHKAAQEKEEKPYKSTLFEEMEKTMKAKLVLVDYSKTEEGKKIFEENQSQWPNKNFLEYIRTIKDPNEIEFAQIIRKYQSSFR